MDDHHTKDSLIIHCISLAGRINYSKFYSVLINVEVSFYKGRLYKKTNSAKWCYSNIDYSLRLIINLRYEWGVVGIKASLQKQTPFAALSS